jgi:hypothetical protein
MEPEPNPNAPTDRQGIPRAPDRRHFADRLNARSVRHTGENTIIVRVEEELRVVARRLKREIDDWRRER